MLDDGVDGGVVVDGGCDELSAGAGLAESLAGLEPAAASSDATSVPVPRPARVNTTAITVATATTASSWVRNSRAS